MITSEVITSERINTVNWGGLTINSEVITSERINTVDPGDQ